MRKLTEAEVVERLESYHDPGVTDELYEFGKTLVAEVIDRNKGLDAKAASMAAYSIGIITLLASTSSIWAHKVHSVFLPLPVFGGAFAFVAAWHAVRGLRLQTFLSVSQNEWLKADLLDDRDALRKYHVLNLWGVLDSHEIAAEGKAKLIGRAQWMLFLASAALVVSLADAVVVFGFSVGLRVALW